MDRGGAAAHRHPGRHAGGEHRAVRSGPDRPGRPRAGRARTRRLGGRPAGRAADPARRRRPRALRRPGAAGRVRPDPGPRPARGDPGRGDRPAGPGHRGARPAGHRAPAARPDRHRHRAPAVLGAALRRGGRSSPTARWSRPDRCDASARFAELLATSIDGVGAVAVARASVAARPGAAAAWRSPTRRRDESPGAGRVGAARRSCRPGRQQGRPAADCREPAPTRTLSRDRPAGRATTRATGWPRSALFLRDWWCSASTARRCRGCGRPRRRRRRAVLAGRRHRGRAADHRADALLHRSLVPGVVGTPDAADQPAPRVRPDRPAPGQRRTRRPR